MHPMTPRVRIAAALAAAACAATTLAACGSGESESTAAAPRATTAAPAPAASTVPRDSEEAASFPLPKGETGDKAAPKPTNVKRATVASHASDISPGAPSDAEIRKELKQMQAAVSDQQKAGGDATTGSLDGDGLAQVPANAPEAVARIISGGNAIAHFPYVYGGGHASFVDSAYDCSGSLSYALAAAGLLKRTMTSGELANSGEPGPGKWVTIYANETHTFMYVAGLRFDTSGRDGPFGSRWQTAPRNLKGFAVRHPPGL